MQSAEFTLGELMQLERACWRKGGVCATPPLEEKALRDMSRMLLALKLGQAMATAQTEHPQGDAQGVVPVALEEAEAWHLVQGVDVFAMQGHQFVGLFTLTKLYGILEQYHLEEMGVPTKVAQEVSYGARKPGANASTDPASDQAGGGATAPV